MLYRFFEGCSKARGGFLVCCDRSRPSFHATVVANRMAGDLMSCACIFGICGECNYVYVWQAFSDVLNKGFENSCVSQITKAHVIEQADSHIGASHFLDRFFRWAVALHHE